ncbi:MAG: DNA-3-methyladenine glycosylase [bacterium]
MRLTQEFFERDTLCVAKDLLGAVLCRKVDGIVKKGIIVETEAYTQEDPSCHAYRRTKRSETMFKEAGLSYVYFTYGMHHCMNIVTEPKERGCAVLIRALEPVCNLDNTNGPARLCKQMQITRELNEIDLATSDVLWIEKGTAPLEIITTTRIGITQAVNYPWRFYIKDNKWVSKK